MRREISSGISNEYSIQVIRELISPSFSLNKLCPLKEAEGSHNVTKNKLQENVQADEKCPDEIEWRSKGSKNKEMTLGEFDYATILIYYSLETFHKSKWSIFLLPRKPPNQKL